MITKLERIRRDIEKLSQFNASPGSGLTRFSLTPEDRAARQYLKDEMIGCGLRVFEDAAGNLIGRREGELKDAPAVMIGSHFDSVKEGGNFDGPAGVTVALETARVLHERNIQTQYPIEVVALIEEEGGRFGAGLYGSRAMTGKVDAAQLRERKDAEGVSMYEALAAFGFDPEQIGNARRQPETVKAFLELHIEQGPILENGGFDIGIVRHIVGIQQLKILVKGRQGHAGTTPMDMRSDAMDVAAKVIAGIGDSAKEVGDGTVATVGWIAVKPGGYNIIPAEVAFSVDIRSGKAEHIDTVVQKVKESLALFSANAGAEYEITPLTTVAPVQMGSDIVAKELAVCEKLGLKSKWMSSGAGHDAMVMAGIAEVGLLFVPSRNGLSHCSEEWTDYEALQKGAEVYLHTVLELAGASL